MLQKRYLNTQVENDLLSKFLKENNLNPVKIYNNLNLEDTKKNININTKGLSGVYLIFNNVTGDYYIGSASTNRFYARFSNHLIHFTGSKLLKNAVKKNGLSNFSFLILELFNEVVTKENNKMLLDLEDFYLKSLLPNYNILTEAGSNFGYKHTDITRIKMKTSYNQERRELIGSLNKGKNLSENTKESIRQKALNRKEVSYTEESLLNMKKNSKALVVFNLNRTVYGIFPSIVEAAETLNCGEKTIRRALKTEKKILLRKYIVEYCDES